MAPDGVLAVLLVRRTRGNDRGPWQLPGTFVHPGETLARAALRALSTKAAVTGVQPRQLCVLDDPKRDDRGWVVSVAHVDVVPADRLQDLKEARLLPVADARGLAFDHDSIVQMAVESVRTDHVQRPDPWRLLEGPFTLLQLQRLHEAVAGHDLVKDTFRRHMRPFLQPEDGSSEGTVGRPARLWRTPAI